MNRKDALIALCQKFGIDILYVFGSRAQTIYEWVNDDTLELVSHPSDVDVGIKASHPLTVHDKVKIALALEDLFGVSRVDLVSLADADPFLAVNVIRGNRLFVSDSYAADEYDLYVMRRAGDLAPFERERIEMILNNRL
jgi:uncharacterized protein